MKMFSAKIKIDSWTCFAEFTTDVLNELQKFQWRERKRHSTKQNSQIYSKNLAMTSQFFFAHKADREAKKKTGKIDRDSGKI